MTSGREIRVVIVKWTVWGLRIRGRSLTASDRWRFSADSISSLRCGDVTPLVPCTRLTKCSTRCRNFPRYLIDFTSACTVASPSFSNCCKFKPPWSVRNATSDRPTCFIRVFRMMHYYSLPVVQYHWFIFDLLSMCVHLRTLLYLTSVNLLDTRK